jgi:hypothetical protein
MTVAVTLEPSSDDSLREYGQRLRVSVAARATVLRTERIQLEDDLQLIRLRAGDRRQD